MKKVLIILAVILAIVVGGCGVLLFLTDEVLEEDNVRVASEAGSGTTSDYGGATVETVSTIGVGEDLDWVMYWYLCGSDLESDYGAATADLEEMMAVDLPENVAVVIQTGGALGWWNDYVDADKMQRFLYNSDGLTLLEEGTAVNMGEASTLADFLSFASTNYPGDQVMVNFWNHGGGSVAGVAFDEQFDSDSLSLDELREAFVSVYDTNETDQPIDIIGFDACLMATLDTAYAFHDIAKYMVASEETEPGCGWEYTGFVGAMADTPDISTVSLGVAICDSYQEACDYYGVGDDITLSVTNLSKISNLVEIYDQYGVEALDCALSNSGFYASFTQSAAKAENYGGNSNSEGYTNMVDLGHLAYMTSLIMPTTSEDVISAVADCVEYSVAGSYRANATGLSCFYTYSNSVDDLNGYMEIAAGETMPHFYTYGLTGQLTDEGLYYVNNFNPETSDVVTQPAETEDGLGGSYTVETLPQMLTLADVDWDDYPLWVDDEGCAVLDLGPSAYDILEQVYFEMYYIDDNGEYVYALGTDNDMTGDWESGVFVDNFRGVWGSLDGNLCYVELTYEGDDYNIYAIPVLINGEDYNLEVVYDFTVEQYFLCGARRPLDDNGMADKNLYLLEVGDVIDIIHYSDDLYTGDSYYEIASTVVVDESTSFYEIDLPDNTYYMYFVMKDIRGNLAYSQMITYDVVDGDIYTSVD